MTYPFSGSAPVRRLSKLALSSLIFGLLGCIPFVCGVLAIVLGIGGLARTRNPLVRGRWMAVAGMVLGFASILAWAGAGLLGGGVWAIFKATEGPRVASHDFLRDVSMGDDVAAKGLTTGMSDEQYDAVARAIRSHGKFVDSTFSSTNITNDSGHVAGSAVFENGGNREKVDVSAELEAVGGKWKVEEMTVAP